MIRARTNSGRLVGEWDAGVAVFRGIPFAEPPVGELRWRPPRPAPAWDGERSAYDFGPAPSSRSHPATRSCTTPTSPTGGPW